MENPWYGLLSDAAATAGYALEPEIFPAATDSRFIRQLGIPAIGFSPMAGTPILLHDHNEYLGKGAFLQGCAAYVRVVRAMAGAGQEVDAAVAAAAAAREEARRQREQQGDEGGGGGGGGSSGNARKKARPADGDGDGGEEEEGRRPSKQAKTESTAAATTAN